jgi:hypothetical protein
MSKLICTQTGEVIAEDVKEIPPFLKTTGRVYSTYFQNDNYASVTVFEPRYELVGKKK